MAMLPRSMFDRVWIMEELNILHIMDKPLVIFLPGTAADPSRWDTSASLAYTKTLSQSPYCVLLPSKCCSNLLRLPSVTEPPFVIRSAHATQDTYRLLFHNMECSTKVGTPRTPDEYREVLAHMSADKRRQWYDWTRSIRVGDTTTSSGAGLICFSRLCLFHNLLFQKSAHLSICQGRLCSSLL